MSPTRRDTLKAAGAASGLAMLGGHAFAQQDTPGSDDDGPGAQQLEEGEAGVRVGHFVAGAPAVNVRLVPVEGTGGTDSDDGGVGGGDANDTNTTDDGTPGGTDNDTGGNASDDNTTEDLQFGNDSDDSDDNETDDGLGDDNGTDDGLGGDNTTTDDGDGTTDDTTTDDGEGELIAENVSFGDVSEYANVEAGDYTLRLVEADGETTGTDGGTDGNATDTDGTANDTGNESDDVISLPPELTDEDNETDDSNDTSGNDTNTTDDNTSEDLQFDNDSNETDNDTIGVGNDTNDTNDTDVGNDTDDGFGTPDDTTAGGEVVHEEEVTVGETYYTVAAVGASADDVQAIVLQDYDAAQVRLVHASPDAPAVDVVAPDATMTLFDGVSFGQATEYVGVPPGSYSLSVREEADMNDGDEITTSDVELDSGEAYSVYAVGSPEGGDEEFQLVVEQDGQGADAGLGGEGAPGQQPGGQGGNETGGPDDDNETDGPGDDGPGGPGGAGGPGDDGNGGPGGAGGPGGDDEANGTDEPGGPGGAAGPNTPGDDNESGNETEEDGGFL